MRANDILNDRVLPFFANDGISILTDNGTERQGKKENLAYELFLELFEVGHRFCKVGTPRTNGFVERFHSTCWMSSLGGFPQEVLRFGGRAAEAWLYNKRPHVVTAIKGEGHMNVAHSHVSEHQFSS